MFELIIPNLILIFIIIVIFMMIRQFLFFVQVLSWRQGWMQVENIYTQQFHAYYKDKKLIFASDLYLEDYWIDYVESDNLGKTWKSSTNNRMIVGPESELLQNNVSEYFATFGDEQSMA